MIEPTDINPVHASGELMFKIVLACILLLSLLELVV